MDKEVKKSNSKKEDKMFIYQNILCWNVNGVF